MASSIAAIVIIASPAIALFYDDNRVVYIATGLAINALLLGLGAQHLALLTRNLKFGTIALVKTGSVLLGGVAGIIYAATVEADFYALLLQTVATTFSMTTGYWMMSGWRPSFSLNYVEVKDKLKMGGNFTISNFINYIARNGDNILIAKYWGDQAVAFYARAYSLLLSLIHI